MKLFRIFLLISLFYYINLVGLSKNITQILISYPKICPDSTCDICDNNIPTKCLKCKNGFFLFNNFCFLTCPINTIPDTKTNLCLPLTIQNKNNPFNGIKSYSIGSCKNLCGNKEPIKDCSCSINCIKMKNCCSDYSNTCEILLRNNLNYNCHLNINHCELCNSINECGKCEKDYFLRNGNCVKICNGNDKEIIENKICEINDCEIQNCEKCFIENKKECLKCQNGFFKYRGQCVNKCPKELIADKIKWKCDVPQSNPWFVIFPSEENCRGRCGQRKNLNLGECNCDEDCFQYGDCCSDIEETCPQFIYWK